MSISEKTKTINNQIEDNKTQCDLQRETAKISALLSGIVSTYECLTDKGILPEKDLLEKAGTMERFQYSPLGTKLKSQTDIARKQYQKVNQHLKNIIDQIKPTTATTVFMNIRILKTLIVFLLYENI